MNHEDERAICRLCNEEICDGEEWTTPHPGDVPVHVECFRTVNMPVVFREKRPVTIDLPAWRRNGR